MYLSIDVGIKNLAMCVMDTNKSIKHWEVSGIPPHHADGLFLSMKKHLDTRNEHFSDVTRVVIEKQPDKNKTMKSMEHFLHTYFLCHDKTVIIWDARHKIPDVAGAGKAKYAERKKASIERCREFIKNTNADRIDQFEAHKKKDDLADTVMQILSYIDSPVSEKKKKKLTARQPTENQCNTRYSRANLAWIVKNNGAQDARFFKDLKRYYSSLDELLSDLTL